MSRSSLLRAAGALVVFALLLAGLPRQAHAQWSAGAGYQYRMGNPGQGVGLRLQRAFAASANGPVILVRASAAYFPEQEERFVIIDYGRTERSRGHDLALEVASAGQHGRFRTYVGLGGGYEWRRGEAREGGFEWARFSRVDAGSLYAAPLAGVSVYAIGGLRPYVEYRRPFYFGEEVPSENSGRVQAGISFSF